MTTPVLVCHGCGEEVAHFCPGPVPPEPPVGTWVKDRHGNASVRNADGWAPAPHGFFGTGRWDAMWRHKGPLVECGPYGH